MNDQPPMQPQEETQNMQQNPIIPGPIQGVPNPQAGSVVGSGPQGQHPINVAVPDEAADSDLIEKEWVERAKQIVDHTASNPYEQQRAVSYMKADYMKKRYNKDIKLPKE